MCFGSKQPNPPTNPAPYPLDESDRAVVETVHSVDPPKAGTDGVGTPNTAKIDDVPTSKSGAYPFKM